MKPTTRHFALIALAFLAFGSLAAAAELPKVKLFTTGGTIQSRGSNREKLMEYNDGKVTPEELIADLPELKEVADVSYLEISNEGSPSVGADVLLKLAKSINEWLAKPESSGAVVTHGTTTLEETAYF